MLLAAFFLPPGSPKYWEYSQLANALLLEEYFTNIDTKVGGIFNTLFGIVDLVAAGYIAAPYVASQPEMPDSVNFAKVFGFKGASFLREALSDGIVLLADKILPTTKFAHLNNINLKVS
jgi:hypothetical protein